MARGKKSSSTPSKKQKGKSTKPTPMETQEEQKEEPQIQSPKEKKSTTPQKRKQEEQTIESEDSPAPKSKKKNLGNPTVQEILEDDLTGLSKKYWSETSGEFNPAIVKQIFDKELQSFDLQRIVMLELSHYLEKYSKLQYL